MKQHCENGAIIAHWLKKHPKIARVYWPGFEDQPNFNIARKQMRDFGGMISFELKDDSTEAAMKVLSSTKIFFSGRKPGRSRVVNQSPRVYDACFYTQTRKN